jgi:hypothetical protein
VLVCLSLSLRQAPQGCVRPVGRDREEPVGRLGTPEAAKLLAGLYTALRCGQPSYPRADAGEPLTVVSHSPVPLDRASPFAA